jgi:hypothetical protein
LVLGFNSERRSAFQKSLGESFFALVGGGISVEHLNNQRQTGTILDNPYCLRCNRELVSGEKSVAVYMFAQTVGVRPRQKSAAKRICFCPQCAISLAMGPPPEGTLNLAAWGMMREIASADPALSDAAWEELRGTSRMLPGAGEDDAPQRAVGGYLEF